MPKHISDYVVSEDAVELDALPREAQTIVYGNTVGFGTVCLQQIHHHARNGAAHCQWLPTYSLGIMVCDCNPAIVVNTRTFHYNIIGSHRN